MAPPAAKSEPFAPVSASLHPPPAAGNKSVFGTVIFPLSLYTADCLSLCNENQTRKKTPYIPTNAPVGLFQLLSFRSGLILLYISVAVC